MTPEWLTASSSVATLFVVALTAFAALRQIRHMRSGNQVAALLPLTEKYQSNELQESLNYLLGPMRADLEIREHREGVVSIPSHGTANKAKAILNFYESVGALVTARVLDLELVLRYFTLPSEIWEISRDYVVLVRRLRGPEIFENLEALVVMERAYAQRHGSSRYPRGLPHLVLEDRWPSETFVG